MKKTHETARTDNNRYNTSNSRSGTSRRYTRAYGVAVVSMMMMMMMMMDEFYYEGFSSQRRKRCKTNGRRRDGKMTMTMTKKTV